MEINFIFQIAVLIIEEWFLECKYNPKYKYCKDWLKKSFNELYEIKNWNLININ